MHPGGVHDAACPFLELHDAARDPQPRVEGRQRNVELLETSAEDGGKRASKRPERSTPLRPDVELEVRGVLVERGHPRIHLVRVTPRATETGKVVEQPTARSVCHEVEILLFGEASEEG